MGDLSENSEYHAAKEELGFADGRRREIEAILKQATVVEEQSNDDIVSLGKTVTVKRVGGDEETYSIVGEFEANPTERKLSSTSPIGAAFMGAHVGQTVTATVPAGSISFEILSIS
jgi:transcription elongation factor GreA